MSTEQVVELNDKSTRLIDKLTKAMNKAADKFSSNGAGIPDALNNATPAAASALPGSGGEGAAGPASQFSGFQDTMNQVVLPLITTFAETSNMSFAVIDERIMQMSQSFLTFMSGANTGMSMFVARLRASSTLMTTQKTSTNILSKTWKSLNKIIDAFSQGVKVGTFVMNAHKMAVAAYQIATGTATIATKRFIVTNRILNAVLRQNPIILLISLLAGAAMAFANFGNKVSDSNDDLKQQNTLIRQRNELIERGKPLDILSSDLNTLNERQLLELSSRNKQHTEALEDKLALEKNKRPGEMEVYGNIPGRMPTAAELSMRLGEITMQEHMAKERAEGRGNRNYNSAAGRYRNGQNGFNPFGDNQDQFGPPSTMQKLMNAEDGSADREMLSFLMKAPKHRLLQLEKIIGEDARVTAELEKSRARQAQISERIKKLGLKDPTQDDSLDLKDGSTAIAAGGKKMTNITINLEKMVENIAVSSESLEEGLEEVESMVKEVFLRVLNSGNYAAQ